MSVGADLSRLASLFEAIGEALATLPFPVAGALDYHCREGSATDDPRLNAATLVTDAALYSEPDATPALVLAWTGGEGFGTGILFLDSDAEAAQWTAENHAADGARAWWCPLDGAAEWREVTP